MMLTVSRDQVDMVGTKLVTEASQIGLKPGEWPDFIGVVDDRGEGFLFGPYKYLDKGGDDLQAVTYTSRTSSVELVVLND